MSTNHAPGPWHYMSSPDTWATVNRLTRGEVEACLNWGGFATYDHEPTDTLRDALVQAIEAGDIELATVEAAGEVAL